MQTREEYMTLRFPLRGVDTARAVMLQREYTTAVGVNVRAYDPGTQRSRGASRSGLTRRINAVVGSLYVSGLGVIVTADSASSSGGGAVQTSESGRVVTLVAVSNGSIKTAIPGDTSWTSPTGGTSVLNTTRRVFMTSSAGIMYFADGLHWYKYNPATATVSAWTASAGSLPVDGSGNAPKLIENWRGRVILAGLLGSPQDIFMSAVENGTDFDYSPASTTPTQAVSTNTGPFGRVGSPITCLIPYTDDLLIIGTVAGIWQFSGDPMAGGALDLVTATLGMAWGRPWCQDPNGMIYFVSGKGRVYTLSPGQQPQLISQAIDSELVTIDTGANAITMAWDDRYQGAHLFITPTAAPATATHWFFETKTGAWWKDTFQGNGNLDPLCTTVIDGNTAADRVTVIGCWDGYVRSIDPTALTDDSYDILSEVWLGPIQTANFDQGFGRVLVKDIQAILGASFANMSVDWAVYVGDTAENALANDPVKSGTWTRTSAQSVRNLTNHVRATGHAVYIKLSSSSPWALEAVRARIVRGSRTETRGR